ncbi:ABC transporter substrate-binding protein [Labrys miyagiensis]|uniref:ABC transporter substrate-binding protein n=1 Tax=Labrys miyagiensis TaxID=346912 RepID=A0ABQ6CHF3_9HYPH|nr:substrate-binding domain-containing protein [Labrys miyagiensis]GLS19659.1 ABC transporter substrate-binding protein [Labrys miyagiensis]
MNSGQTKFRLRLLTIAVNEQFFTVVRKGMNDAAAAMQVEADLAGTPGVDPGELVRLTREAIADGVDGIGLNICDADAFTEVIAEARARSIPVVAFNIDASRGRSGNLSSIAQEFHSAGEALGRRAAAAIPKGANVIITVHDEGVSALEERLTGVQAGLQHHAINWQRLCTGQDPEKGAELLHEAIARFPVQALLGTGQADTEACGLAAKSLAPSQPYVAGFDLSPGIVELMAEGYIDCAIDQQPYAQGFYPIVQLALYLRYGLLPSSLDAGAAFIDRANLEAIRHLSRQSIR